MLCHLASKLERKYHCGENEVDVLALPPPPEAWTLMTTRKPLVAPEISRVTEATPEELVVAAMVCVTVLKFQVNETEAPGTTRPAESVTVA